MTNRRPEPERGIRHILAALSYSLAGFQRLWLETAFRLELAFGALILLIHLSLGNDAFYFVIACLLVLFTLAIESVNTAIETIVDHISPEWSEMAKNAKDLGSFAVFCLLMSNGAFLIYAIFKTVTV